MTLITLLPIYWLFVVSARTRVELFGRPTLLQTSFYIDNYLKPLSTPAFQRYLTNSLIVATSNALLVAVLAVLATYALSRWKLGGSDSIFFWLITNRMAPAAAFILPLYLLFTRAFRLGDVTLYDTRIGLILLYCLFNLPFAIWLMKGMMDGIPIELDEAAFVDGASTWTVLTRIIVPLAGPHAVAATKLIVRLERIPVRGVVDKRAGAHDHDRTGGVRHRYRHELGRNGGGVVHLAVARAHLLGLCPTLHRHGLDLWRGEGVITLWRTRPSSKRP